MRRLLAVAAIAAVLAHPAVASARARPYAAEFRTATTTFELGGRDGRTWLVGLTVEELRPVGGAVDRSLLVTLRPCTTAGRQVRCAAETAYRTRVTDGGVAADLATAYVRVHVMGAPVDVSWVVSGTRTDTLASVSDHEAVVRRAHEGGQGPADGVVLGPRCHATGTIGGGYVVRAAGPAARAGTTPPAHLPAAIAPSHGWVPACV
jgi:hypothetical protein